MYEKIFYSCNEHMNMDLCSQKASERQIAGQARSWLFPMQQFELVTFANAFISYINDNI